MATLNEDAGSGSFGEVSSAKVRNGKLAVVLTIFNQGLDVTASNASRLLEPERCEQPPGPPWIDREP